MSKPVDTKDPTAVKAEVQTLFLEMFPAADRSFVPSAFGWIIDCFTGSYPGYQPVDASYHDLEHTLQGTLCMTRLLHGRALAQAAPVLTERQFQLGLAAILLHDTGYLKKQGDKAGTGAKYTLTHVARSADFAAELLLHKGFTRPEIHAVQHMIRCTGLNVDLAAIPFVNEVERIIGYALGTGDLLGQMAAADYVDKLPILYAEFVEAAKHSGGKMPGGGGFTSAEDLMSKTPVFWEKYVRVKIERDFVGLHHFLERPYPGGPNEYIQRVEANIARLRARS